MADKQISILLVAKNMASKTIGQVNKDLGKLGGAGRRAGQGLRTLAGNVAKLGAVAAVGIGVAVKNGIDSLVELESAVTNVDGAIAAMGLTGKVAGSQVASWANEIETNVQAAFDDKEITAGAGALIRYGKVTEANLRPAMEVMTDLAAKTGSVESAATLLAKALADPAKAAGKLARQGVILTKAEQDQIKAFMKAGKQAEAQAMLLEILSRTTKGAAEATQGPYKRAMSVLADVTEDAQRAIAEGFLPVLQRVADWLSKSLADPKVMADIRGMGKSLAGAFDEAVTFAQKVPWGAIKDGLKTAAQWAGRLFDAFRSLPPEFQATIVALAGLNKLSGGAVSGIVSELGKGLIKGVLGMTAGIVHLKAATVIGGPGGGGGGVNPAAAAGSAGVSGALMAVLAPASVAVIGGVVANALLRGVPAITAAIYGKPKPEEGVNNISARDPGFQAIRQVNALLANVPRKIDATTAAVETASANDRGEQAKIRAATDAMRSKQGEALTAFRAGERTSAAGFSATQAAIRNNRPIVTTNVKVNVTAASVTRSVTVHSRLGPSGGSRNGRDTDNNSGQ